MFQHLIVTLIFAACLYLVIRRIVRYMSRAKKGNAKCSTCTETSCPLHEAYQARNCNCGCSEDTDKHKALKNCNRKT